MRAAFLVALVVAGAAGCSSSGGSMAPTTAPAQTKTQTAAPGMPMSSPAMTSGMPGTAGSSASAASISIKDFDYGAPITVSPGATVMVTNMDSAEHTVTADQGSAFDVEVKENGGTGTFTAPTAPGTYPFHCTYHPNMHGTLTVQ
ncbi:plastocyanin [Arthrobacter sp. B3I9]|uniref:cupredoxin domain-containing protein n=1 Tax=Arthrobacter sp. B3I9 TaxID=3042270 RepID=UPI00278F0540|nr:cupredoxin domain-containing protein [Arthrobacter sp. B3I9]MDQ0849712.1 plastocyanin [Arthrobacter sp. B3I9]